MTDPIKDIRYLEHGAIDIVKWDQCILHAGNGLIYARSFFLDAMTPNWSALVAGDYEQVMPLTWNRKFGFTYLYQPYFTKTLGVFGNGRLPMEISSFLHAIPRKYKFWDIDLNENNFVSVPFKNGELKQYPRTNHFLALGKTYEQIEIQYHRLAKRMKKKAAGNQLRIIRDEDPALIIPLYRRDYAGRHRAIPVSVYDQLTRCTAHAFKNNLARTYLAQSPAGETLAYYIILQDDSFIYSLLGGSTEAGKKLGAFYLLTDAVIRDHAGSEKIFRFEGSDIPGISFFNALFGPRRISYQHLELNNLPFPFSLFK